MALTRLQIVRYALWALVAVMAAVFGLLQWAPETLAGFFRALGLPVAERVQAGPQLGDGSPYVGGAFDLIDHEGKPRRDADFRGRYMLVYFGYTYCPDVCPTELQAIAQAMDLLGPDGDKVQPIFISVDPDQDTPAILKDYVDLFHPRLIGLTGSMTEVTRAAKAYRVFFNKVPDPDSTAGYAVDHSSLVYLMDPTGKNVGLFRPGVEPEAIAKRIKALLDKGR